MVTARKLPITYHEEEHATEIDYERAFKNSQEFDRKIDELLQREMGDGYYFRHLPAFQRQAQKIIERNFSTL